jgi:hypothetical protein
MSNRQLYDQDFYAWANEQAGLLRDGRLSEADVDHIAEEIDSLGKAEKRELASRLTVLLHQLLKWQYQPHRAGASWQATIRVQRRDLTVHMADNPSLKSMLPQAVEQAYGNPVIEAGADTGLPDATFPPSCPWTYEQMMDPHFWPGSA